MRWTEGAACSEEMLISHGAWGRRHQGGWEDNIKIYLNFCVQFWSGFTGLITRNRN